MFNWLKRLLGLPETNYTELPTYSISQINRGHMVYRNSSVTTINRDYTEDNTMLNLMTAAIIADELSHSHNTEISTPSFEGDGGSSGGGGSEGSWDSSSSSDSGSSDSGGGFDSSDF